MPTKLESNRDSLPGFIPEDLKSTEKTGKNIGIDYNRNPNIKNINLSGNQLTISAELSGVLCQGIQYYDLKNILFINNTGMANLIDLLKSLLKQGVEVRFVNVNEKIKKRIKSLGLDHILICS